jgi:hypothetical protein
MVRTLSGLPMSAQSVDSSQVLPRNRVARFFNELNDHRAPRRP